ncbi:hypothetical protein IKQ21_03310 [bacterium]|nr:hypothetical protein [bacterium]
MLNPVNNADIAFKSGPWYANALTYMTSPDALGPILALETTVDVGRSANAYKRGGKNEMRERLIEDLTGAAVWLFGVKLLNSVGDKILKKKYGTNFDVGSDVLRTPFDNFIKNNSDKKFALSKNKIAWVKAGKVLTSVLLADAFIGLVVPKLNQKLTKMVIANDKKEKAKKKQKTNKTNDVSFKGGVSSLNVFTNAIENTNIGKLISTDAGLVSGRMYSARNNDERREIGIRDIGSMYFFYWAIGHVGSAFNFAETGHINRLNPSSANILNDSLVKLLEKNGNSITVEEFEKLVLGKDPAEIDIAKYEINFETGKLSFFDRIFNKNKEPLKVAKVSELEGKNFDKATLERIKEMSKLQPLKQGEAVVTKQQIIDAINVSELNNPKLLGNIFSQFTGGKGKEIGTENGKKILSKTEFIGGDYINEYKYVSNEKLYKLKSDMETYVKDLCKKSKDGKITKELLEKFKNKNTLYSGINFMAGFAVAALFLSTLIPKFQYWVTKKKSGIDAFPGTYDYKNHKADDQ